MSLGEGRSSVGVGAWLQRLDRVDATAQARRDLRARAASGGGAMGIETVLGLGETLAHDVLVGRTITGELDEERFRISDRPRASSVARTSPALDLPSEPRRGGGSISKLAAGYQPAVVKVVSYASNAKRASATAHYVQRDGVALETQDGERLETREAVQAEIDRWSETFRSRADSQDAASVKLRMVGLRDDAQGQELLGAAIRSAFEGHPYAWRMNSPGDGSLEAHAVVVLAGAGKERFRIRDRRIGGETDGFTRKAFDASSEGAMKARIEAATGIAPHRVDLTPGTPAHGVSGLTHRLDALVEGGSAHDHEGKPISDAVEIRKAAQAWRSKLRSHGARETMHLVMSSKAGVDLEAFTATAREFLRTQFADNKFMFAVHTDKASEGHIHAHAIIALRSADGQKLHPGRQDFAEWRRAYAEQAQAHGLKIVATHAAERASSQSYGSRDKAIVDAADRPRPHRADFDRDYAEKNPHVVANARQRIETARANPIRAPRTRFEREIAHESAEAWRALAAENSHAEIAKAMTERVSVAALIDAILQTIANRIDSYETGDPAVADLSAEQMYMDLRTIDKTVASVAEQLSGPTRQAFLVRSQDYLVRLAARVDIQRAIENGAQSFSREEILQRAGAAGERIVEEADRIAGLEARQAADAQRIATTASNAELRDEGSASAGGPARAEALDQERQAATFTPRNARAERQEADAAAEAARLARQDPAVPIPTTPAENNKLDALRREQEALARRIEEDFEQERNKGQRMRWTSPKS